MTNPISLIEEENVTKRRVFEENLLNQGLEIERTYKEKEKIFFVKVCTNIYFEINKLKLKIYFYAKRFMLHWKC